MYDICIIERITYTYTRRPSGRTIGIIVEPEGAPGAYKIGCRGAKIAKHTQQLEGHHLLYM
jgi:hypothetical protein